MASITSLPGITPPNFSPRSVNRIQWLISDKQNTAKMMSYHLRYRVIKRYWFTPPASLPSSPPLYLLLPPPSLSCHFLRCPKGKDALQEANVSSQQPASASWLPWPQGRRESLERKTLNWTQLPAVPPLSHKTTKPETRVTQKLWGIAGFFYTPPLSNTA